MLKQVPKLELKKPKDKYLLKSAKKEEKSTKQSSLEEWKIKINQKRKMRLSSAWSSKRTRKLIKKRILKQSLPE